MGPLAAAMSAGVAAHRAEPESAGPAARSLLHVADAVAAGAYDLEAAYRATADLVAELGIDDAAFYAAVVERLYAEVAAGVGTEPLFMTIVAQDD